MVLRSQRVKIGVKKSVFRQVRDADDVEAGIDMVDFTRNRMAEV